MNSCIWILLLLAFCGGNNSCGCGCSGRNRLGENRCGCQNECGQSRERRQERTCENERGRERMERRERERNEDCGCANESSRLIPPPPRSPFEDCGRN